MARRTKLKWPPVVASAAVAFVAVPVLATAAQALTPREVYKALLASTIPPSQLPAGFHSSKTKKLPLGATTKLHHALGEIGLYLDDGTKASIIYVVFPTHTDALGTFADAVKDIKTHKSVTVKLVAPGLPEPSIVLRASGLTQVSFVIRNVEVNAITTRGTAAALSLAQLGLKHLNAVT